jgi:hypothetical protein
MVTITPRQRAQRAHAMARAHHDGLVASAGIVGWWVVL